MECRPLNWIFSCPIHEVFDSPIHLELARDQRKELFYATDFKTFPADVLRGSRDKLLNILAANEYRRVSTAVALRVLVCIRFETKL